MPRIAILDSGIHPGHPHVTNVVSGFNATRTGAPGDWLDITGHGTAVAGAILSHAPQAELLAVKIFDGHLRTGIETIARAVHWALEQRADFINLSLGSANAEHRDRLARLVALGGIWVSAAESEGVIYFPGSLPQVHGVIVDASLARDEMRELSENRYAASPYPREIPGVPREQNLHGISFAVANVTGILAARER
jgi:subtilisin family serine protease